MNANYLEVSGRTYYAFEEPEFVGPPSPQRSEPVVPTFGKYNKQAGDTPGFWRRQFGPVVTSTQRKFDWSFGVFLPLVCFYFDPFVFTSWVHDQGLLHDFKLLAYILSSSSILAMTAWLLWGDRLKWLTGWLAGLFFAAGLVACVIGIILSPISLIGVLAVIGLLGFSPLITGLIFLRNGVRAMRAASPFFEKQTLVYVTALGGLISLVLPWLMNESLNQSARQGVEFIL